MDKKREMIFNLNSFLLAFSEALNSKKRAYLALNIAKELKLEDKKLADITSLALGFDLGLKALKNFAFVDKSCLEDKEILEILNFSNDILKEFDFVKNSIENRSKSIEFVKNSSYKDSIKNAYLELCKNLKFFLDLENSDEIVFFIYSNLQDFTTVLKFEDIFNMTKELHYFENKNSKLLEYAEKMADFFEFEHKDKEIFKIASSLQNIGKLYICKDILEKKESLTAIEKEIIKAYPYHTNRVLKQIMQFDDIAKLCQKVQERVDGSGYFQGFFAKDLSFKDRLLSTLLIYSALREKRAYRDEFSHDEAIKIMSEEASLGKIDESLVDIFDKVLKAK